MKKFVVLLCALAAASQSVHGQQSDMPKTLKEFEDIVSTLHYQKGSVSLQGGLATVTLPENFLYLSPKDTETVVHRLWGNPAGMKTLGMLVPEGENFALHGSWAVVITYLDEGYVKDSDAEKIDYTKLLKEMQEGTTEANKDRTNAGYPAIELVGWAKPPHYDKDTHKMYWAKEIRFDGNGANTLNYDIRVLGRGGVLELDAVAPISSLPAIEEQVPELVKMVDFNQGKRYADFDSHTDKVAAYGLAALVAGGIAAKAGLFKLLWVAILALKKLIILGFVALAGLFKKIFGRKQAPTSTPPPAAQ